MAPSNSTLTKLLRDPQPIFILRDTATNQKIYYIYNTDYEVGFPFVTSKIKFPEKEVCAEIERRKDDFTNEITLNTPADDITIIKVITGSKTSYYLSLETIGYTVNVSGTGATVLFTDGTKWSKPVPIDVDATDDGYKYSAFILISTTDLTTFYTKAISKFRLYVYDQEVNRGAAEKLMAFTKCLTSAK
jgi:hypothetical protein